MTDTTPRAGAPLLAAAQAQKQVTHNEALYRFDALLCTRLLDRDLSAPPASPADGDTYLVKATASGDWAGQTGKIAYCADGAWRFYAPFAGLVAYVADETALIIFDGSAWMDYGSLISLQNVPHVGVNATADSTNKLSVRSNAALFSDLSTSAGGSGDMRVMFSKQSGANTASLLFQDNFSTRAEIGLTGDDDFHLKVSADGSTFLEALKISSSNGLVTLPGGQLAFPATQNPSSNANTLDDYEEGTFTPTIIGDFVAGTNTYVAQVGSYTKIGNTVFYQIYIRLSALGGTLSGNIYVAGLPYTSVNTMNLAAYSSVFSSSNTLPSGTTQYIGQVAVNDNRVGIFGIGTSTTRLTQANLSSGTQLGITGSYQVAT